MTWKSTIPMGRIVDNHGRFNWTHQGHFLSFNGSHLCLLSSHSQPLDLSLNELPRRAISYLASTLRYRKPIIKKYLSDGRITLISDCSPVRDGHVIFPAGVRSFQLNNWVTYFWKYLHLFCHRSRFALSLPSIMCQYHRGTPCGTVECGHFISQVLLPWLWSRGT